MASGNHKTWLEQLARENALIIPPHSIVRGKAFAMTINYAADLSADAFAASLRNAPGAEGASVADFTIVKGAFANGVTPITLSLTLEQTGSASIPEDSDLDGLTWLVFDLFHTPVGKSDYRIGGGEIPVSEKVT